MRKEIQHKLKRLGLVEAHQTVFVSSVVNKVIGTIYFIFFFFMKRLIHANKTLKSTYTLKHKVIYIHFMPPHAFLKIYTQT